MSRRTSNGIGTKSYVIILISLFTATILFYVAIQLFGGNSGSTLLGQALSIVASLLITVIVGFLSIILERYGVLLPIQKRIATALAQDKKERKRISDSMHSLEHYKEFDAAWHGFGLRGVAGLHFPEAPDDAPVEHRNILVSLLKNAKPNTVISYMNTRVEDPDELISTLPDAVAQGAKVRMLLLDPEDERLLETRYSDVHGHTTYPDLANLRDHLNSTIGRLRALQSRLEERGLQGSFSIKLFRDSLGYPMAAVHREIGKAHEPISILTGFYGAQSSENMPYVRWEVGRFDTFDKFIEMFNRKWNDPLLRVAQGADSADNKQPALISHLRRPLE